MEISVVFPCESRRHAPMWCTAASFQIIAERWMQSVFVSAQAGCGSNTQKAESNFPPDDKILKIVQSCSRQHAQLTASIAHVKLDQNYFACLLDSMSNYPADNVRTNGTTVSINRIMNSHPRLNAQFFGIASCINHRAAKYYLYFPEAPAQSKQSAL